MTTNIYNYIGANEVFTIPFGVLNIHAKLWGAGGGGAKGVFGGNSGAGGYVEGTIPVNVGDLLSIMVGEAGKNISITPTYGGGGAGGNDTFGGFIGGAGGGRSEIYLNGIDMLIAGGGGGNAGGSIATPQGGSGGGLLGLSGTVATACLLPGCGGGGTQSAGGSLGQGTTPGTLGASFQGGSGGPSQGANAGGGGGGGGGYFGGGGGAGQSQVGTGCAGSTTAQDCPGGGGSSFIGSSVISGISLAVPNGTLLPPHSTDPDYITGRGIGVTGATPGGDGLVVISYSIEPFSITKSVDKIYSDIDTILNYTLILKNVVGTTVTNLVLIDTTPTGTTFINGSLQLNSTPIVGDLNPPGLKFSSIAINEVNTVTFSVSIPKTITQNTVVNNGFINYDGITLPMISNTVTTTISGVVLDATKSTTSLYSFPNDTITYSIVINSTGTTDATNVIIIDTIPSDTVFINNSLKVNGITISGGTITPPGYNLGTIPKNTVTTLTYNVKVTSIPSSKELINLAGVQYKYTITPTESITVNNPINRVTIPLSYVDLSKFKKSVNANFSTPGKILVYTIEIPNTGTVDAMNAIFKDTIPSGTTFIQNSITINGVSVPGGNIETGINLESIPSGTTKTVTFQVLING